MKKGSKSRNGSVAPTSAKTLSAKADYINAVRLADKQNHLHDIGVAAEKVKLPRTQESLEQLGAGKTYGVP